MEYVGYSKNKMVRKDFLWGGAVAAHQCESAWEEGEKGISCADVGTARDNVIGALRCLADGVLDGEDYPNHVGIDFYHHYKEEGRMIERRNHGKNQQADTVY